jgi:hypothetical protein
MYIFHSAYNSAQTSAAFKVLTGQKAINRATTGVARTLIFGPQTNSAGMTIKTEVPAIFQERAFKLMTTGAPASRPCVLAATACCQMAISHLPAFDVFLRDFVTQYINTLQAQTTLKVSDVFGAPMLHSDIMGMAVVKWLESNRAVRTQYNDVTFAMVMLRENFSLPTNLGHQRIIVGNGFSPDLDWDKANHSDVSVGIGQRHAAMWSDLCKWFGFTPAEAVTYRPALGRFPWWLQALLMAADVQRLSIKYAWLRAPKYRQDSSRKLWFIAVDKDES